MSYSVLISTAPSFRNRSSVGILALSFRPLYSNMSLFTLLSFLLFLRDSNFNFQECQSYSPFHTCAVFNPFVTDPTNTCNLCA